MATWAEIYRRASRRYGLQADVEDALLLHPLFLDRANEILAELAGAEGFREDFTLNLPTTSTVALSERVIAVLDGTVRCDYDGSGQFAQELQLAQESELRSAYGVLENREAGVPCYYYTQRGTLSGATLKLALYPRSDTAVTSGLKLSARVAPALITDAADLLPLQQHEERFLIPGICLALAETEFSRGNQKAPLELWDRRWEDAKTTFADLVEDGLRGDRRRVIHVEGEEWQ